MIDQITVESWARYLEGRGVVVTPCPQRMVRLEIAAELLGLRPRGLRKRIEEGRAPQGLRLVPGGRLFYPLGWVIELRRDAAGEIDAQGCASVPLPAPTQKGRWGSM
jgi:hypothetical protein